MYTCFDIAKQFLDFADRESSMIDPMKLLKLVYISHGWHLGTEGKPLINNEIKAWKYGPVIPELYFVIKRFGAGAVDKELLDLYSEVNTDEKTTEFLKVIWDTHKHLSALELSAYTHQEGSPWSKTYNPSADSAIIPNYIIQNYYHQLTVPVGN